LDAYRDDPIGSLPLADFINSLEKTGFIIKKAHLDYEPVFYKSTDNYVNDVKAYGYGAYLGAIKKSHRANIWQTIRDSFINDVGDSNYTHDQYMIYTIAYKP
jgi:hypothetical protein